MVEGGQVSVGGSPRDAYHGYRHKAKPLPATGMTPFGQYLFVFVACLGAAIVEAWRRWWSPTRTYYLLHFERQWCQYGSLHTFAYEVWLFAREGDDDFDDIEVKTVQMKEYDAARLPEFTGW